MTEERIVQAETPPGNTPTTTIITDRPERDSGTSLWFVMFAVLIAVLVAVWAFSSMTPAEDPQDAAADEISEAAGAVGAAANEVGDAAEDVGAAASDAATDAGESAEATADEAQDTMAGEPEG